MRWMVVRFRISTILVFLGLLLCAAVILTGFPHHIIQTLTQPRRLPIYSVQTDDKLVAIGLNCAWGDEDVPALLEILADKGVRASFFVTGTFCRKFPGAVKAIAEAGHELGSHSNTHVDLAKLGREGILEQIRKGNAEIAAITGEAPVLFRTPSGSYNDLVIETILDEGMIPIQWDCDSIDYENPPPQEMQERILGRLRPGSITLFHAGAKNTPAALPGIIDAIRAKGYDFQTVGEMVYPAPYTLDHEGRQHKK